MVKIGWGKIKKNIEMMTKPDSNFTTPLLFISRNFYVSIEQLTQLCHSFQICFRNTNLITEKVALEFLMILWMIQVKVILTEVHDDILDINSEGEDVKLEAYEIYDQVTCRQIYLLGDLLQLPWTLEATKTAQLNFILKMDIQPTK